MTAEDRPQTDAAEVTRTEQRDEAPDELPATGEQRISSAQEPDAEPAGLTHVRADGSAHMVDVSGKAETTREATAEAMLLTRPDVIERIFAAELPKGDALPVARVAGIMAAKRTPDLVPLCHPLPLSEVTVDFERKENSVRVTAAVRTRGATGVEMEALTAASVAALSLYDMIKAVDRRAQIDGLRVLAKSGGASGDWRRED